MFKNITTDLSILFKISRSRFWTYLGGTYLVGYTLATKNIFSLGDPHFLLNLIYFLTFANLFLYGINDWYDEDTDKFNDKKRTKENFLKAEQKKLLKLGLIIAATMSAITVFFLPAQSRWLGVLFIFLCFAYSAPPFRFKAKPGIDFISNILYILPGIIGYYQGGHLFPPIDIIIACSLWAWAMHLFSAIPDIEADKKAHLKTSAVVVGRQKALILCLIYWLIFSVIIVTQKHYFPFTFISIIYPSIAAMLLVNKKMHIGKIYWYFPYINGVFGFGMFLISVFYQ
jgi:4-hydroxybenzoate polyprenyltransferase